MSAELKTLIAKLNPTLRQAMMHAANLCVGMGQFEMEPEHVLQALLDQENTDLQKIAQFSKLSVDTLRQELQIAISEFTKGSSRTPVFSMRLQKWLEHAWLIASLELSMDDGVLIRSGHCLQALLANHSLAQMAYQSAPCLRSISVDTLKHQFDEITANSTEQRVSESRNQGRVDDPENNHNASVAVAASLKQYTVNLTQLAKESKLDPVIGRDNEIRQMMDVLMRRRQNNPILTGEPGVGKTAVVEGLALRIVAEDVPEALRDVHIHALDMGLLQAGASVKGEFEQRLKGVMDDIRQSVHPIILFIDEAHTMIGAGGQAGQNDAANLLKPALARGELRTIAATTWAEYKKYFEKDAALARRFQVVKVEEPSEEVACAMLRGMAPLMEKHFNVQIFDDAIVDAVRLSHRFMIGRQLPDKAVSVLDTACAKVALGQSSRPALIERSQQQLRQYHREYGALLREEKLGYSHSKRKLELETLMHEVESTLQSLEKRWSEERALVSEIVQLRQSLMANAGMSVASHDASEPNSILRENVLKQLSHLQTSLKAMQNDQVMTQLQVDATIVAEVIADWTGIPLGRMRADELDTVINLPSILEQRVIGQGHAIRRISERVQTSRAQLDDPNKPKGIFLLVGPSGVGKTETALAMTDAFFGGEHKMVTINMSEYQEAHSVSGLKGSPPGYVGYGEGGVLTEAVRQNPYCVVLLDEVEKAHPDVMELFFQVFDKGVLEDAEGRLVDFKNTMIFLTSNIGSAQMMQACLNVNVEALPKPEELDSLIRPLLCKAFKPALLGRLNVIPYYPLRDEVLVDIIRMKLKTVCDRFEQIHEANMTFSESVVDEILARCQEVDSGARNIDSIINHQILPPLSLAILKAMTTETAVQNIRVSIDKKRQFRHQISYREPAATDKVIA